MLTDKSVLVEQCNWKSVNEMDITAKRREGFDLYTHRFSGSAENYLYLLFSDQTYNARSPLTILKARLIEKLSGRNQPLHRAVLDVVSEFREIMQIEDISHLVLYGENRSRVLVALACYSGVPQNIPIVLSRKEIAKEEYPAQQRSLSELFRPYQIDTDRYPFLNKF